MAFFEKEVATTRCGLDWLGATGNFSNVDVAAVNRILAKQHLPYPPRLQRISRPMSNGCRANRVDNMAFSNLSDNSPFSKTSDTDSGTTSTSSSAAEHFIVQNHVNKQKSLYKTELCRSWEEKGRCPYGSKCQYAHGTSELRPVARHPKFKTEVCCTFVTTGTCPYGRRCRFIHKNVPITAVGKQVSGSSKKNESHISSASSITASSRRLPIFVKLARGEV